MIDVPLMGGTMGEIFVATASAVSESGVSLLLAGQQQATRKTYRSLASAQISAGDQVICVRLSGTIVVLGRIGLAGDDGDLLLFIPRNSTGLLTLDGKQFVCRRTE